MNNNEHNINSLAILALIEKYEDKIAAIKTLQSHPIDRCMDPELIRISKERLETRLYERNTFLEDLKSLLTDTKEITIKQILTIPSINSLLLDFHGWLEYNGKHKTANECLQSFKEIF